MKLKTRRDNRTKMERAADAALARSKEIGDDLRSWGEHASAEIRDDFDDWSGVASARWREIRDSLEDIDTDQLRADATATSRTAGKALLTLGLDVKDITARQADRLSLVIDEAAAAARAEAEAAERKKRIKALVGWTVFGIAAGFILAGRVGGSQIEEPRLDDGDGDDDESLPDLEQPTDDRKVDEGAGRDEPTPNPAELAP